MYYGYNPYQQVPFQQNPYQQNPYQQYAYPQPPIQQGSFPELVGRSVPEAVAYISARGYNPVPVGPNQPMTMDYRADRVRIMTCPSGRMVVQVPTVG